MPHAAHRHSAANLDQQHEELHRTIFDDLLELEAGLNEKLVGLRRDLDEVKQKVADAEAAARRR